MGVMAYDNTNSGAIFVNDRKESEKHPDRSGSLNVEGVDYWINGWLKKDRNGKPYMSLSVNRKDEKKAADPDPNFDPEEDVPF
jgi:hypothetical protein